MTPYDAAVRDWALHYHRCPKCGGFVPCQTLELETCAAMQIEISKTCGQVELRADERHHGQPPAQRVFILHCHKKRLKAVYAELVGVPGDWLDRGMAKVGIVRKSRTLFDRRADLSGVPRLTDAPEEVVLSRPHTHHWKLKEDEFEWGAERQVVSCACGARGFFTERTRTLSEIRGGQTVERVAR